MLYQKIALVSIFSILNFLNLSSGHAADTVYRNPHLAQSTWPIYHANTYATASSPTIGKTVISEAQAIDSLTSRRVRQPAVSPWVVMQTPYRDGSQAVITTPNDGVAKYLIKNNRLEPVHFLDLDRRTTDFDWGIVLLRENLGITTERRHNRFVIFGDAHNNPQSPLVVKARIPVNAERYGDLTAHFSITPDGKLIALTSANKLIAIDIEKQLIIAEFNLPSDGGTSFHNSFPIDERGRIFLSTQQQMAAVDWSGTTFNLAWIARYDMRGPGCEDTPENQTRFREAIAVARGKECTGSGTTPTLIGDADTGVVVLVDGHSPANNLVAFWRNAIPDGWLPRADPTRRSSTLDPRVADVIPLPHSTPQGNGFTAENSPAALGNSIIVAQWAGFRPSANAKKGLQRVDWDARTKRFKLAWANPTVHFNGVPTIACNNGQACRAYGMGRYNDHYRYVAVDFDTGVITNQINLGTDDGILDQGNNHAIAQDGSIVYSGKVKMVRIK